MTEDEAKTKACCGPPAMANAVLLAAPQLGTRPIDGANLGMCVASACMAWRVTPDPTKDWSRDDRDRHREQGRSFGGVGYCGLAGGQP